MEGPEAQVVLVGFPCAIGYAYYPVRVEPATEDPNAWWGLREAIERHIAASSFPLIRQLAEKAYCIRPYVDYGPPQYGIQPWLPRSAPLPRCVKLALIPAENERKVLFSELVLQERRTTK